LVSGVSSITLAETMMGDLLGLPTGWPETKLTQKGVFEYNDTLYIVYYLAIPNKIENGIAKWLSLDKLACLSEEDMAMIRFSLI